MICSDVSTCAVPCIENRGGLRCQETIMRGSTCTFGPEGYKQSAVTKLGFPMTFQGESCTAILTCMDYGGSKTHTALTYICGCIV